MKQKLSTKEREEIVTKGFFLEQDYVNKSFVMDAFETFEKNFAQYVNALMEDNRYYIQVLIDATNARFERIERHVGLEPWGKA